MDVKFETDNSYNHGYWHWQKQNPDTQWYRHLLICWTHNDNIYRGISQTYPDSKVHVPHLGTHEPWHQGSNRTGKKRHGILVIDEFTFAILFIWIFIHRIFPNCLSLLSDNNPQLGDSGHWVTREQNTTIRQTQEVIWLVLRDLSLTKLQVYRWEWSSCLTSYIIQFEHITNISCVFMTFYNKRWTTWSIVATQTRHYTSWCQAGNARIYMVTMF